MHKGITAVIATVLLLLVTISLVGMAFVFLGRTTETATATGQEQVQQQAQQVGVVPQIVGVDKNTVILRSAGGSPLTSPTFYVAGRKIDATGPSSLAPGEIGTYVLNETQMADLPKMSEVKVTTAGFSDAVIAAIKELAALIFKAPVTITGMVIGQQDGIAFQNFNGSTVAVITEAGDVGIGTTSPGTKLDVAGGQFRLSSNSIGSLMISQYTDLTRITSAGASGGGILALQREATVVHGQPAGSYSVELWSGANGGTQTLTATGGNVGIGTTGPENAEGWNKVVDLLGSSHAKLSVRTATIDGRLNVHDSGFYSAPAGMIVGTKSVHPLSFITGGASRATIDTNGNVGIGTTPDSSRLLHLLQSGSQLIAKFASTGTGSNGNVALEIANSNGTVPFLWYLQAMSADGRFRIYGGSDERLSITSTGNVGIGTTSPAAKLSVNGNVKIGSAAAQANKALCWRGDNTIGYCSSSVDGGGNCTCNTIG